TAASPFLRSSRTWQEPFLEMSVQLVFVVFILQVLGVRPKESSVVSHISLDQRWCVAFEDTICVSFDVVNISEQNHMQPVCHTLDSSGFVRCVLLNEGSEIHLIRPNSSAEMLVGFSKSQLFKSKSCPFLLEMILHASDEMYWLWLLNAEKIERKKIMEKFCRSLGVDIFARSAATQTRLHSDTRVVTVSAPSKWYSFEDFLSAKEPEILLLLRCLRVGCFSHAMRPTSSFEFAEANPDFDCCDFGDWQVLFWGLSMSHLVNRGRWR
ncbi:hypothetical protein COOONC_21873, partial [Cooperia oncophora]